MTAREPFDPEAVRAFVDGDLDDMAAARLSRAAQDDAALAAAIAAERRLRETLAAHFAPVLSEPVPERLTAPVDASRKVVTLDAARERRSLFSARTMLWAGPALAAALVLAVLVPRTGSGPIETRGGQAFAANDLAQALDSQLVADQRAGADTRVLLSFADEAGTLCRGFTRTDVSGIACREDGGWHLRLRNGGVAASSADYRQAGSAGSAIVAVAQEMASGPALDAAQERAAKAQGWRGH